MGKTFKDGRINQFSVKERESKRTQKNQNYGTSKKAKKELNRWDSEM